jgi:hypothetical protein
MIRRLCLPAIALALFAAPAYAQDSCAAPTAPKVPDGKTAAAADIIAANKEVVAFMKASDDYQTCLVTYINEQDAAAKKERKTFDPKMKTAIQAKGDANQKEKERVGMAYNTAAQAYRAAHPR